MSEAPREPNRRRKAGKTAVAVPMAIFSPFIVFFRSLRDIWRDPATQGILIMAALLMLAGTVIFMFIEGFSPLDSFYFCFVTLATIGYGDLAPSTDLGKMFTVIYGISGLGITAALIRAIATHNRRLRRNDVEAQDAT